MTSALIPLQNITLGSAAASVTFGSIPSTIRDLRLVVDYISTNTSVQANIRINADTGSNYSRVILAGYPTTNANSGALGGTSIVCMNYSAPDNSTRVALTADFMDASTTNKHKTILLRSNHGNEIDLVVARWASMSAITSLSLFPDSGTFATGSTFTLFGVTA